MIDVSSSGRSARCRWRIAVPAGPDEETGNRKFVMISVVAIILGYWGWRIIGSADEDLAAIRRDAETARAKQDAGIRHDFEADAVRISELHKSLQEERARAD